MWIYQTFKQSVIIGHLSSFQVFHVITSIVIYIFVSKFLLSSLIISTDKVIAYFDRGMHVFKFFGTYCQIAFLKGCTSYHIH